MSTTSATITEPAAHAAITAECKALELKFSQLCLRQLDQVLGSTAIVKLQRNAPSGENEILRSNSSVGLESDTDAFEGCRPLRRPARPVAPVFSKTRP